MSMERHTAPVERLRIEPQNSAMIGTHRFDVFECTWCAEIKEIFSYNSTQLCALTTNFFCLIEQKPNFYCLKRFSLFIISHAVVEIKLLNITQYDFLISKQGL